MTQDVSMWTAFRSGGQCLLPVTTINWPLCLSLKPWGPLPVKIWAATFATSCCKADCKLAGLGTVRTVGYTDSESYRCKLVMPADGNGKDTIGLRLRVVEQQVLRVEPSPGVPLAV